MTNPDIVVVTKQEYFNKFDMLDNIKENGILLINCTNMNELVASLENLKIIKEKNISIITIDAENIALKNNIKGKINKIMEVIILKLLKIDDALKLVENSIKEKFRTKGENVIQNNINALNDVFENINKININEFNILIKKKILLK
jgi:pyruvate-ferredoxin/flavodoxin oxidoreductase